MNLNSNNYNNYYDLISGLGCPAALQLSSALLPWLTVISVSGT